MWWLSLALGRHVVTIPNLRAPLRTSLGPQNWAKKITWKKGAKLGQKGAILDASPKGWDIFIKKKKKQAGSWETCTFSNEIPTFWNCASKIPLSIMYFSNFAEFWCSNFKNTKISGPYGPFEILAPAGGWCTLLATFQFKWTNHQISKVSQFQISLHYHSKFWKKFLTFQDILFFLLLPL